MSLGDTLVELAIAAGVAAAEAVINKLLSDEKDREIACALVAKRLAFRAGAQARLDRRKDKT